jgi:hypothetical protein
MSSWVATPPTSRLARKGPAPLPGARPFVCRRPVVRLPGPTPETCRPRAGEALFRRHNQGLIGCADLVVGLDDGSQRLFRRQFFFQRLGQHVFADHVAIGDDAGAQVAQHADARQPAGCDVDRVGIDGPHVADSEQTHAHHRDEQERHHGDDLGADGIPGKHG